MWGSSTMDVLLSKLEGYGDMPEFEVFKIEKLDGDMWRIECKDNRKDVEAARKEKEAKQDA
ncbi:MAG: hypothetical protein J6Y69_07355 [Treponema sp.]|nr:hypothetical protein [Treponema sp.]